MKVDIDAKKIKDCARANDIDLVVLYGSQISGIAGPKSDVDLGVRSKKGRVDHRSFINILNDFVGIFGDRLDLVFINEAPPLLRRHMALYGKALYEEKEGIFDRFKVEASHLYADTKKFRDLNPVFVENYLEGVIPVDR